MQDWYLIRTKTGAERTAYAQLQHSVDHILLPLAKTLVRQRDRSFQRVSPVFPSYLFAQFDLARMARQIRYTPGVSNIVRFGEQAAVVPACVIDELIARCGQDPVDLVKPAISPGTPVKVVHGPFRELQAVFDGYLSGTERVAILLKVMNEERRVVMPARMVIAAE